jgi:hypothetical protein
MNDSRRRAAGITALVMLVIALTSLAVWRLTTASRLGWAGMTYLPVNAKRAAPKEMPMGMKPGGVLMVYPGAPASKAGIRRGDEVKAINGIPANDLQRLTGLSGQVRVGDVVTYTISREGVVRTVPIRFESPTRSTAIVSVIVVNALVAFAFLIIGTFVFLRRPSDTRIVVFFVMTLAAAASFVSSALSQIDTSNIRGIAVQPTLIDLSRALIVVATTLFFAPLLLHLSLIFPVERPVMKRRGRTLKKWIYGLPVYSCVCILAFLVAFGIITNVASANEKAVTRIFAFTCAGIIVVLTLTAIVRLVMRMRRDGAREGLISSPIAVMTVILGFATGFAGVMSYIAARTHSPAVLIVSSIGGMLFFFGLLTTYPIATVIALYRSYRESGVEERRQVKWPLWGTIVAVAARLVLLAIGVGMGLALTFGRAFDIPPMAMAAPDLIAKTLYTLIPLSFAFAILKYRLMNIDVIIRRTVLYTLLTGVIFVLYAAMVAGLGTALVKFGGVKNQSVLIASTVVIALVTVPLRNRLQQLVDRNLFRERRDFPLALRNIGNAIASSTEVDAFLRRCAEEVQQALQNRFVLIALRRDQEFVALAKVGVADEVIGRLRIAADSVSFSDGSIPEPLRRLGARLIVPVSAHRQPRGLIALGSRLSDEEFSPSDVEFILAAASQVAVGTENVRLRDEEADFEQARLMQQILLPKSIPQLEGFEITGLWQPARSVGGDYFDVLPLGQGRIGICIADVAGKGMPAALLMANLQAAVKATASRDSAPSDVCKRVKQIVIGNLAGGKFISMFYGVLDAEARTFTYCNAGHNPPIVTARGGRVDRLMTGGPAICRLFQDADHEHASVAVERGDRIILFTDGVSEARRGEEEFGEDRLIEFAVTHQALSARAFEERLLTRLREFTAGEFSDDVTLVVVSAD